MKTTKKERDGFRGMLDNWSSNTIVTSTEFLKDLLDDIEELDEYRRMIKTFQSVHIADMHPRIEVFHDYELVSKPVSYAGRQVYTDKIVVNAPYVTIQYEDVVKAVRDVGGGFTSRIFDVQPLPGPASEIFTIKPIWSPEIKNVNSTYGEVYSKESSQMSDSIAKPTGLVKLDKKFVDGPLKGYIFGIESQDDKNSTVTIRLYNGIQVISLADYNSWTKVEVK